jgi:hypothetical protein
VATSPEGVFTELEIESFEQLYPGVRIRHPQYGIGEIRRVEGRTLLVKFAAFERRVNATSALRVVVD